MHTSSGNLALAFCCPTPASSSEAITTHPSKLLGNVALLPFLLASTNPYTINENKRIAVSTIRYNLSRFTSCSTPAHTYRFLQDHHHRQSYLLYSPKYDLSPHTKSAANASSLARPSIPDHSLPSPSLKREQRQQAVGLLPPSPRIPLCTHARSELALFNVARGFDHK